MEHGRLEDNQNVLWLNGVQGEKDGTGDCSHGVWQ